MKRMPAQQVITHADRHDTHWTQRVQIGGFEPFSTINWPGKRTATVFLRGCPWRCAYCHNPRLQMRGWESGQTWADIAARLESTSGDRRRVVFSGGEPLADRTLPEQVQWARERGFKVGLHTGGAYPERLAALLPMLDWIGFDLKTDCQHYDTLTGAKGSAAKATQSARLIVASGIDHEFRLTWHHEVLSEESALLAAHFARHLGARRFVMQEYRAEGVTPGQLAVRSLPPSSLLQAIDEVFPDFECRRENCGLSVED